MVPPEHGDSLTVSQLARRIQGALDDAFGGECWVEGELHSLKRGPTGHVWFDLVETGPLGGPPVAQVAVVLFESNKRGVNALLRRTGGVRMTDGMAIRIRGSLAFYPPQGRVQFVMTGIDAGYTLGKLAAERDRVLRALAAEGLLDRNGGASLTLVPLRVGLVTAAESAACADFVEELDRSGYAFRILHADSRMQGAGAERSIIAAMRTLVTRGVDVVAIVRGGGARTDLSCFDSEALARTIADLPIPVWTGIGHETDRSVADEVAHAAHKTPTACASALVTTIDRYLHGLRDRAALLSSATTRSVHQQSTRLHHLAVAVSGTARRAVDHQEWQLGRQADLVVSRPRRLLADHDSRLMQSVDDLERRADNGLDRADRRLDQLDVQTRALDPERLLARGWTITRTAAGAVARVGQLRPGDELVTTFADGSARSSVSALEPISERDQ